MFSSRRITTLGGSKFQDNYSVEFSGDSTESNEYMACSDTYESMFQGSWSLSMWIKPEDGMPGGYDYIFGSANASGEDKILYGITTDGKLRSIMRSEDDQTVADSDVVFADGASDWVHCLWSTTKSATDGFRWFFNGVAVGSVNSTGISSTDWGNFTTNVNPFMSGFSNDGSLSNSFQGNISEAALYNVALDASDAATIYNSREAFDHKDWSKAQNVVGWFRFGDGDENGQGTTIYDLSGNGNNGTLNNTDAGDIEGDTP